MINFMNDANCHLRCERYVANPNGSVRLYILEVIDAEGAESLEILVTPRELVSLSSMKRILCGKRVFYSATKVQHEELLCRLFSVAPKPR